MSIQELFWAAVHKLHEAELFFDEAEAHQVDLATAELNKALEEFKYYLNLAKIQYKEELSCERRI